MSAGAPFGRFSADFREYVVTDWRTPRPWCNVVANPRVGLTVSQTGSGFSWIDNSQLAAIVRWQQDLAEDRSGRFLYVRDHDDGRVWSLAPAPCRPAYDRFACRHGIGYTTFESELAGIAAEWTLFVDAEATVECWRLRLRDLAGRPRRLLVAPYLEWNCGTAPAPRREFQKLFLETRFDAARGAVLATSRMWDVPSPRRGHWNTSFPYWSAFAAAQRVAAATGDKAEVLGPYGDWAAPAALRGLPWRPLFGRHHDPVAALACEVELAAGEAWDGGFALATAGEADEAAALAARFAAPQAMDRSLAAVRAAWRERLAAHRVETPEPTLDALANDWLRYQAISARLWGRAGYYQQSGAYGYRDQLQDAQVWLTIDPARCREQVRLHARHQFADGPVVHWWHPLSEQGHVTRMSDDLLWLAFVLVSYLKETGEFSVLDDREPFLDDAAPAPLAEHVERAFASVFRRTSPRGLPYIGAGDWNDGLSALGLAERGESVWLAEFLAGLLADWAEVQRRRGEPARAAELAARRRVLVGAIEEQAWDGAWYRRATRDDGEWIGSAANRCGRIFLNAQVWAILADVAPPARAEACLEAVRRHLLTDAGALLLAPAWDEPDERVGYITRYAPGLRENGGVYTHAATWALAAAAKCKDGELVGRLLAALNPALKDPRRYWAEPYVLPGNVDGPGSPYPGRGGWTWYTGAAAWLPRVLAEWVLGVRPTWDGLLFDPCLPPAWERARMVRPWRGARLEVEVRREGAAGVTLDGRPLPGGLLRQVVPEAVHRIAVVL
ncbi:MAG TPA: glycosyl hydrolase family 65 protein [Thermoanaerobaculia bacterium]|nr:glycosyl hydrolase family 65 protein [Thermoanaerobaculia bacterium]